jgi:iron-sulfur cluster assembly protein
MAISTQPEITLTLTPAASAEVRKFIEMEKVSPTEGGLRVSNPPGGCSGFKYSLLIEDKPADDDLILEHDGFRTFVDPFSAQYVNNVTIDYVTSMQGSGFTFKNPNATGGCGCGSSFAV